MVMGALDAGEPLVVVLVLPHAARLTQPTETIPVTASDRGFRMTRPPLAGGELCTGEQTIALA
jgi:hypothetical protein